jgi:hypothetical protein
MIPAGKMPRNARVSYMQVSYIKATYPNPYRHTEHEEITYKISAVAVPSNIT